MYEVGWSRWTRRRRHEPGHTARRGQDRAGPGRTGPTPAPVGCCHFVIAYSLSSGAGLKTKHKQANKASKRASHGTRTSYIVRFGSQNAHDGTAAGAKKKGVGGEKNGRELTHQSPTSTNKHSSSTRNETTPR